MLLSGSGYATSLCAFLLKIIECYFYAYISVFNYFYFRIMLKIVFKVSKTVNTEIQQYSSKVTFSSQKLLKRLFHAKVMLLMCCD